MSGVVGVESRCVHHDNVVGEMPIVARNFNANIRNGFRDVFFSRVFIDELGSFFDALQDMLHPNAHSESTRGI